MNIKRYNFLLGVEDIVIEYDESKQSPYRIWTRGDRWFIFLIMIPIIGNLIALIWFLCSFKTMYITDKTKCTREIIFKGN